MPLQGGLHGALPYAAQLHRWTGAAIMPPRLEPFVVCRWLLLAFCPWPFVLGLGGLLLVKGGDGRSYSLRSRGARIPVVSVASPIETSSRSSVSAAGSVLGGVIQQSLPLASHWVQVPSG